MSGNSVPGVPSNKIAAGINYNSAETGLFGSVRFVWEDKYFANDFNGPVPGTTLPQSDFINDGYVKTDLRLGYLLETDFTNAQFFLGVNNIFDGVQTFQLAGNSVPSVPSNKIAAEINYNSAETGLFGSVRFVWEDKYFANDFNGPVPGTTLLRSNFINDGYVKTDLRFGYLLRTDFTNAQFFLRS